MKVKMQLKLKTQKKKTTYDVAVAIGYRNQYTVQRNLNRKYISNIATFSICLTSHDSGQCERNSLLRDSRFERHAVVKNFGF